MAILYSSIFSRFHANFNHFKCLTATPFRSANTKRLKRSKGNSDNLESVDTSGDVSDYAKSTNIVTSKDLLSDFIKEYRLDNDAPTTRFVDLPSPANVNIFTHENVLPADSCNSLNLIFDAVENLEASLFSCALPNNQFEEWLKWTVEKKMWSFPINNEQDWNSELDVPFHEHVFLENHLNKEHLKCKPLASFLELVCTGLSKNPYFSVDDKKQHLEWFTQFFDDKITRINVSIEEEEHMTNLEKISRGTST
ncbi:unnamed protein product [Schistosoma rodhaini]|uniref:Small ribosomal subunit protein mS31 n=1 Tax=Schistosoma rodhaini TaxID=6188 RepID=A0AA85FDA1_9TREM|nr:unnamed protein product [Schistosoma rodhaini]CAH8666819.1 unnamed protein product [Schistosoma rodhaini]